MIITKLDGVFFNSYGNTKDSLPKEWRKVNFDFRIKKHRLARDHKNTRIVIVMVGWKGPRKFPKPELEYYSDTLELVERIKKYGDIPNSIAFIREYS